MTDPTPNQPTPGGTTPGDDSLVSVLAQFTNDGWTANHQVVDGGRVKCGECGHTVAPGDVTIEAEHRIEGASDPDDMQYVAGFACPKCGARGALVVAYGPTSSIEEAEFMQQVSLGDDDDDPVSTADEH